MTRGSVLVVDDDAAIRQLLTHLLSRNGYAVRTASNGAEGLALVEDERPDLVLLDKHMPVLDGPGFAAALRERGSAPPICAMSASADAESFADAIEARVCLPKPFPLTRVLAVVEEYCGFPPAA